MSRWNGTKLLRGEGGEIEKTDLCHLDVDNRAPWRSVRLCDYAVVRTTLDISDEAYDIARSIARDQNRSLGRVVGDLILQAAKGAPNGAKNSSIAMSDYGFPVFRCTRPVTTEDVKALDDEE